MTKRGEPLPINQALNRPRAKLGLDLSAWMAIVFVCVTVFLVVFVWWRWSPSPRLQRVPAVLTDYVEWYKQKFGAIQPEWYVFPFGSLRPTDPTRHVTTLKTVWTKVRANAGVKGRWHDNRHTLITELAESGAGDQTIMDIAGHVSKQMLKHYSHIRMEAKRSALEAIVRKSSHASESHEGYPQKSPQSPQNGGKTPKSGHAPQPIKNSKALKNGTRDCSESPGFTQDFEGEYPQKSPQPSFFEGHRGVGRGRKSLKIIGSSGRTRTYNPSVNSRRLRAGAHMFSTE